MTRHRLFWGINLLGWGILWVANIFLRYLVKPHFSWTSELIHSALLIVGGLLITAGIRQRWKGGRLLDQGVGKAILLLFIASIGTSGMHTVWILALLSTLPVSLGGATEVWTLAIFLPNWSNLFFIHALWMIVYLSIQYVRRVQQLRLERVELEKALNEARLNSLMGQLNPHYLFNALNNIRALMLEDVPKARTMLGSLSANLRYALSANQVPFVPLSTELEMVAYFIALARIQLEERLIYQHTIEEGLSEVVLPPMLLQLLVENAIKHGIAPLVEGGILTVEVSRKKQALHLTVTNDYRPTLQPADSTQIGLHNIRERLRLLYQGRAQLTYEARTTQVQVHIVLPLTPTA